MVAEKEASSQGDDSSGSLSITEVHHFIAAHKSIHLSTLNPDGFPDASYTPFILNADKFYIFISGLAQHSANLLNNPDLSIMMIEPEAEAQQIFARKRLIVRCRAVVEREGSDRRADEVEEAGEVGVEGGDVDWADNRTSLLDQFEAQHGAILKMLKTLTDFKLFQLQPRSILFIKGFGQAFRGDADLEGHWPQQLQRVTGR